MKKGVDRTSSIVIDVEDKITALEEADTRENQVALILRSMNSLIGETSNCATTYHNKIPKTKKQKQKYESYVDLLSVINGKAIDAAKTGIIFNIPRNIAKYGKPLPYFMKYAGSYYAKMKTFSFARSNMNKLCFELEKWDRTIHFKKTYHDFNYKIMIDDSLYIPDNIFARIENIYLEFCKEMELLKKEQKMLHNYEKYRDELEDWISQEQASNFEINWQYYYSLYKKKCIEICSDEKLLANIAALLCYEKYPQKNKKFLWVIAGNGIVENIKQVDFLLPCPTSNGSHEYLGKKYNFEKRKESNSVD